MLVALGQLPRPKGHQPKLKKGDKDKPWGKSLGPKPATPKPETLGKDNGKGGGTYQFLKLRSLN